MDTTRRTILTTGAAVAAAAASGAFAQQRQQSGNAPAADPNAKFYVKGDVRIHYQDAGQGFPLLIVPGGGLNSTMPLLEKPFDPRVEFKNDYRCITADLRNANGGQSTGPLEVDRPWDAYTDDHLGLMDHWGLDKFAVIGCCIGGPFIWTLLRRPQNRIVAAVRAASE